MAIDSVHTDGPTCNDVELDGAEPSATPEAAPAPAPLHDEVVDAEPPSVLARLGEWGAEHLETEHRIGAGYGERGVYASDEHGHDVLADDTSHDVAAAKVRLAGGEGALQTYETGDAKTGGSLSLGYAKYDLGAEAVRKDDGTREFNATAGVQISAVHAELHSTFEAASTEVKSRASVDVLSVAAQAKSGFESGPEGAKGTLDVRAQATLAQVQLGSEAAFRIGKHEVASAKLEAQAGVGVGVHAKVEAGFEDGKLSFGSEAGAGLGAQGGVGLTGNVNTFELVAAVHDGGVAATGGALGSTVGQVEAGLWGSAGVAANDASRKVAAGGHERVAAGLDLVAAGAAQEAAWNGAIAAKLQGWSDRLAAAHAAAEQPE